LRAHHRPTSVEKITRSDVEGFLIHLQRTRSQGTAHNRFRALRSFLNFCADEDDLGIIERSPMRKMQLFIELVDGSSVSVAMHGPHQRGRSLEDCHASLDNVADRFGNVTLGLSALPPV
jgi:hypothetical protein